MQVSRPSVALSDEGGVRRLPGFPHRDPRLQIAVGPRAGYLGFFIRSSLFGVDGAVSALPGASGSIQCRAKSTGQQPCHSWSWPGSPALGIWDSPFTSRAGKRPPGGEPGSFLGVYVSRTSVARHASAERGRMQPPRRALVVGHHAAELLDIACVVTALQLANQAHGTALYSVKLVVQAAARSRPGPGSRCWPTSSWSRPGAAGHAGGLRGYRVRGRRG